MGFIQDLTGKTARKAAEENKRGLAALKTEGLGYLDTGLNSAIGSIDTAKGYYDPVNALATKYGAGTDLYLDSLGVNGSEGNQRAVSAFQTAPGYDFAKTQALDALDRRAASRGLLASGNNTNDTLATVTGLANQEYGNWQNRLAGLISPELSATTTGATGLAGLEAGKAPIYVNDANSRVNLASNVTNGINSQNTQAANAAAAGAGNIANLGVSLAMMAAGLPPVGLGGGTSNLGGMTPAGYSSLGKQWYNS